MKNIILIVVLFCSAGTIQAQDVQLLDNDWYIEKVEIEGIEIFPPQNNCSNLGRVFFENDELSTSDSCCGTGSLSGVSYLEANQFELLGKIIFLVDTGCTSEQWDFFASHSNFYFGEPTIGFYNPYSYEIINGDDGLALVVTNGIGDKAYYNNVLLDVSSVQNIDVNIYPNPATTQLFIQTQESVTQITIYAISGQKVMQITHSIPSVDVSNLDPGIYFVEVQTQKGKAVQKLIKN